MRYNKIVNLLQAEKAVELREDHIMSELLPAERVIKLAEKVFDENHFAGLREDFVGDLLHGQFRYQSNDYSSYLIGTGLTMKDVDDALVLWERHMHHFEL